jgi:glyoxylase-like metal-dependent hydrolase (beta-lactamase superfamily II)
MSYEVYAIRYATRSVTKSGVYYHFEAYGEPDAEIGMDYFFWLLRDGDRTVLVDCGYEVAGGERRGRTTLCPPAEALARAGVEPGDVSHLILSHLHYDHTGLAGEFRETPMTVHRRELDFWTGPLATKPQLVELIEPEEIATIAGAPYLSVLDGGSANVDDGIEAICVGGHSPGQLVLVVEATNGPVVLASDAIHYYEELERDWPFAVLVDLAEIYEGYATLRELGARPGAVVLPGHDPEVCRRYPSDDELVYRIA